MNRAIKRSMQRKQAEKQAIPAAVDNSKLIQHIAKRKAMNDGMVMGFIACLELVKESLADVHGIGEKRSEAILRGLEGKLADYKSKYKI
jgi:hypothetical protein